MNDYNQLVETCFFAPLMVGTLDVALANCVHYRGGLEGFIDLYLQADTNHQIKYARFKARGNPYLLAGAEYVCRLLQGLDLNTHSSIDYKVLMKELALPYKYQSIALLVADTGNQAVYLLQEKMKLENEKP